MQMMMKLTMYVTILLDVVGAESQTASWNAD
jgi:hypothetical protein